MGIQLLTGSYSGADEHGIKLWDFNAETGILTERAGIGGIDRPSFIAVHPDGIRFVAASETGNGELVSFELASGGAISELSRQPANGDHPCHVCIEDHGEWVLSVNYSGGNVNVYPLRPDGSIGGRTDSVRHEGAGLNRERQDAPHPHSVYQVPGTDRFIVSDLGTDTLTIYELDRRNGTLTKRHVKQAPSGSGPRHLAFHPSKPFAYSLGELDSTVTVYESGSLTARQTVSLIPKTFSGCNTSAEIAVSADGRFLYASNRGHDSIASFEIMEDGRLKPLAFTPAGGAGPRHFLLLAGWIIAANEQSHSLSVLKIASTGVPGGVHSTVETKAPVCVKAIRYSAAE